MSRKRKADDAPNEDRSRSNEQDTSNAPNIQLNSDIQQNTGPAAPDMRTAFSPPGQHAANFLSVAQLMNMQQAQYHALHSQSTHTPLSILLNSISTEVDQSQSRLQSYFDAHTDDNGSRFASSNDQSRSNGFYATHSSFPFSSTQDSLYALTQIVSGQVHQNRMVPNHAAGMPFPQQGSRGIFPDSGYTDAGSLLNRLHLLGMLQNQEQSATAYQQPNAFLAAAHMHNQTVMQNPSQNHLAGSAARHNSSTDVKPTSHAPFTLYMTCDDDTLSDYQCLIRKHIELFEATDEDICTIGQGRNRRVRLGQVGVRCKYCRHIPQLAKTKGAVYFPFKAENVYQACQNMAAVHLCDNCPNIPASTKAELQRLAKEPKSTAGGGKQYWTEGVRTAGIVEDEEGRLRFGEED